MDPALIAALAGFGAMLTIAGTMAWRLGVAVPAAYDLQAKGLQEQISTLERRLAQTEETNRRCERRVDLLLGHVRRNGIDLPPELWEL